MSLSTALTNGGDQTKRRELDFYPTPPEVTESLLRFLGLPPCSVVWEPACGKGAMSNVIKNHGHTVISSDLRETGFGVGGMDFLTAERIECDAVITNPPFHIADEFIRKAVSVAPVVAMVLKSQYWHAKKRLNLFSELPPTWVLPMTWRPDFLFDEREGGKKGSPTMDCIWCIWIVGDTETKYRPLQKPRFDVLECANDNQGQP